MKKTALVLLTAMAVCLAAGNGLAMGDAGVDIHGFISQGYLASDKNNYMADTEDGSFDFNEFGINFSTEFDKLRVGMQVLSRDLGESGNNEPVIDWAFGDYHLRDELGVQFGKMKMPVGLYNQERDIDLLRIPILLPASVYDEGARDNQTAFQGAGIYGVLNSSALGMFDYEVFYGNFEANDDSVFVQGQKSELEAMGQMMAGGGDISISDFTTTTEYIAGAALKWSTPVQGLRVGYSYNQSAADISGEVSGSMTVPGYGSVDILANLLMDVKKRATSVASIEYTLDDFTLAGELFRSDIDMIIDIPGLLPEPSVSTRKSEGWYVQSTYRFTDLVAAGVYYSEYYPDEADKEGASYAAAGLSHKAWQKEIVPTVRFDLTYNMEIKAEVHFVDGTAQVYALNNPDGVDQNWTLYALKATLSF